MELGLWVTALLAVIGLPLAWWFARSRRRWTVWVESLFSLTLVLPPTVVGFYLLVLFSPFSPVGNFLETVFGWKLVFTFSGLVVASCVAGLPFMLTALRTGFVALPESLLEASWTLGKGRLSTYFLVVLPNLKSALLAGAVTTFAHTLGEFGVVLMLGGSIPGVTKVVSIALYEQVEAGNFAQAHVYAVVLLVLSYAGIFLLNSLERRSRTVRR
ncbi:MAG: molybdate ABC transporter permease subunit [Spirochaetales bacterium]